MCGCLCPVRAFAVACVCMFEVLCACETDSRLRQNLRHELELLRDQLQKQIEQSNDMQVSSIVAL